MTRAEKASRFREIRILDRSLHRNSGTEGQAELFPIGSRVGSIVHVELHEALYSLTSFKRHARGTAVQMKKPRLKSGCKTAPSPTSRGVAEEAGSGAGHREGP